MRVGVFCITVVYRYINLISLCLPLEKQFRPTTSYYNVDSLSSRNQQRSSGWFISNSRRRKQGFQWASTRPTDRDVERTGKWGQQRSEVTRLKVNEILKHHRSSLCHDWWPRQISSVRFADGSKSLTPDSYFLPLLLASGVIHKARHATLRYLYPLPLSQTVRNLWPIVCTICRDVQTHFKKTSVFSVLKTWKVRFLDFLGFLIFKSEFLLFHVKL